METPLHPGRGFYLLRSIEPPMDPGTVEFVRRALSLKDQMRRGWQRIGIDRPESVADHSWGVSLLALVAAEDRPQLDRARLLELAITHDIAEAIIGDLIPGEYADKGEKIARERRALETMIETLPLPLRGRLLARFEELASNASPEARLIHELDKLEMAFQAERYHSQGRPSADLVPFHESAAASVSEPRLADVLRRLR
jgi:putative hydrolase of HD superfamily